MWTAIEDNGPDANGYPWCVLDEKGVLVAMVNTEQHANQIALLPDLIESVKGCGATTAHRLREKLREIEVGNGN